MNNNIFISIASYRDNECIKTIHNLYQNAKNPHSIFIGICQQNNNKLDDDVLYNINNEYKNNIKILRIPYYDAKGPYYARYLCSSLIDFKNEKYFLQIDSHSSFIKHWDDILINMYNEIINLGLSKKPIISYYPKDIIYKNNEEINHINKVPVFTGVIWKKEKGVFILKPALYSDTNNTYINTPYSAAGMIFSSSSLIEEVPFTADLINLFDGEEIYNSIRFYLNDYDIFIPKKNIIYHEYGRINKPKFWDEPLCKFDDTISTKFINKFILNLNYKIKSRTIKDFYNFANININDYIETNYIYLYIFIFIFIFILIILFMFFYKY
jgi:[Skp1-protein]-hydroxyproline N-acetylglucosaminyltransferase